MSKSKIILSIAASALLVVFVIALALTGGNRNSLEKREKRAVTFLSDFFLWNSERGIELMEGGEEAYIKRWGTFLSSSAIENLMQNREPTKYDLIYGANGDAKVQNIVCDFDEETSCRFSLDILYLDENDTEKVMNISGQLRLTNADSFCIDNVHFILD